MYKFTNDNLYNRHEFDKIKFGDPVIISIWNTFVFGMFIAPKTYSTNTSCKEDGMQYYEIPFAGLEKDASITSSAKAYTKKIQNGKLPIASRIHTSRTQRVFKISKNDLGNNSLYVLNELHNHFNL